ncbi:DUF115 domain-containing protein [Candidatus Pacearchaeota archaeon]|nr:DUF115 domain-containing protein [Candidatus Pacearchaeota archaeon]
MKTWSPFSVTPDTINPYISALYFFVNRLQWDLHPYSWLSRKKIRFWKNRYRGKKAIILCNGPSLNEVDFTLLQQSHIFTFGLNKINLLFENNDFRPSAIVVVNSHVMEQNKDFYNSTDIPIFLDSPGRQWINFRDNVIFLHSATGRYRQFAKDCSISVFQGSTVTYVAMQLAFHMGFHKVGLVGCDHSFISKGKAHETFIAGENDLDHFHPRYFAHGDTWQFPDLTVSEIHYENAREIYEKSGRKIVNCTTGGKLEIFAREKLLNFLCE